MNGTFAATATSDGRGSVALGCGNSDVGPRVFESLFVPTEAGFVWKMSFERRFWAWVWTGRP